MTQIVHPEFRDYFETTRYPFADSASLDNAEGDFIGESIFLDASFYPVGGTERLYLSRVEITNDEAILTLGDENTDSLASATFSLVDPGDEIRFTDSFGRPAGLIVSEASRLATFQSWSLGTHLFSVGETEFAARVCIPTPEIGLRGILLEDGSVFTDDIWIVGDDGVIVRRETVTVPKTGFTDEVEVHEVIRIDVVGDPLYRRRLCANVFETPRFLRTITFKHGTDEIMCGPDDSGDVKVSVGSQDAEDTTLRLRILDSGLQFEAVGEVN